MALFNPRGEASTSEYRDLREAAVLWTPRNRISPSIRTRYTKADCSFFTLWLCISEFRKKITMMLTPDTFQDTRRKAFARAKVSHQFRIHRCQGLGIAREMATNLETTA
eukprot:GFKZ01013398.1.p1 GENE.GFKZ01013398.1~~GFKZ01013398.1.p1  ORF type:complete len:109 (-),score=4.96 GFKZ01013398.1:1113-1439(-)